MGLALPLFCWLVWLSRGQAGERLNGRDGLRILLLGMFGYYLSSLFDFYGLEYISAGLERLILFSYPTLVLLLQALAVRQWPGRQMLLGTGLCYGGLAVAFLHDVGAVGGGEQVMLGAAWVFASAVTFALYYFGAGVMLRRLGSMRLAGLAGGASSLMVLAHYAVAGDTAQLASLPLSVWGFAAAMALCSTVLPIYWMALAIQRMGPTQTAAVGNLGPVLTLLASWAVLSESVSLYQLAGLGLVLLGISRLKPSRPAAPAAAVREPDAQPLR